MWPSACFSKSVRPCGGKCCPPLCKSEGGEHPPSGESLLSSWVLFNYLVKRVSELQCSLERETERWRQVCPWLTLIFLHDSNSQNWSCLHRNSIPKRLKRDYHVSPHPHWRGIYVKMLFVDGRTQYCFLKKNLRLNSIFCELIFIFAITLIL